MDIQQAVIVGAGPYGLSIAAHLRHRGVRFRIFGSLMQTWSTAMPAGMLLKSDGFASNLSDPAGAFTLEHFCQTQGIVYDHTRIPVSLETFVRYGQAFQRQLVPDLEAHQVASVLREKSGYRVLLDSGEVLFTQAIVVAVGVTHFAWVPPELASLPASLVQHSSAIHDLEPLRGRKVAILGAGASAIDLAALLHESGARVTLIGRAKSLKFHGAPTDKPRSWWQELRHPRTGIGPGLRSKFYTEAPQLFHKLPRKLRMRIVRSHLGPSAGWPMKDRVQGRVPALLGRQVVSAEATDGTAILLLRNETGAVQEHSADLVIAATGYRVDLRRLKFLEPELLAQIEQVEHAPVLRGDFQSSVPGLYFAGLAAANSFGPMFRFVYGAEFAARRIAGNVSKLVWKSSAEFFPEASNTVGR